MIFNIVNQIGSAFVYKDSLGILTLQESCDSNLPQYRMSLGSLPENKQDLNTVLNVKMKVFTVFFLHIRSLLRVYSYLQPTVIILIVKVIFKHSD